MAASSRGWHALAALSRQSPRLCSQCARGRVLPSARRAYSDAAAAAETQSAPSSEPPSAPTLRIHHEESQYRIKSGLILTRAPLLTREPNSFESAFFLYQKRLNERLVSPFNRDFYFKPDTPPLMDWQLKVREREGIPAKEIGIYRGRGATAWADEAPLGSKLADQAFLRERLARDAQMRISEDGEMLAEQDRAPVEYPEPRRTEADETNDVRRLDRALDRTLYLVVKGWNGKWGFPAAKVTTDENLHETAARALKQAAGVNMNTWIVGRAPVAHHVVEPVFNEDSTIKHKGSKTFFLKGRIMTGQADIKNNGLGITDFKWLTQEELKKELTHEYYHSVRNMMALR